MGIYATALIDHNLTLDNLHTLPDVLNASWQEVEHLSPLIEGYPKPGSSTAQWEWHKIEGPFSLDRLNRRGSFPVIGYEFIGHVSERVLRLGSLVKWSTFLVDGALREKVRSFARHIAASLGSKEIIFVPSSIYKPEQVINLMYKGKGVPDMIAWLRESCGPPAETIASIYSKGPDGWQGDGYYIERIPSTITTPVIGGSDE